MLRHRRGLCFWFYLQERKKITQLRSGEELTGFGEELTRFHHMERESAAGFSPQNPRAALLTMYVRLLGHGELRQSAAQGAPGSVQGDRARAAAMAICVFS